MSYWHGPDLSDERLRRGFALLAERRQSELAAGATHVGWKVGWNDLGFRALLGVPSGVVGYLTDASLATYRCAVPVNSIAVEVELALVMASDVESERPLPDDLAGVVADVRPAIEVVEVGPLDVVDAIERNAWHRAYALGPAVPWRPGLIESMSVEFTVDQHTVPVPPPAVDRLADVHGLVRFVAAGAEALGARLCAGDTVLAGNLAPGASWVTAPSVVSAHLDELGRIEIQLVEENPT